ncbi:MAG: hypothetical protein WCB04_12355 [Mycobacteriales bacterium]
MHVRTLRNRLGDAQRGDLLKWLLLAVTGLAVTAIAVHAGARLGTASAPFVGRYRVALTPGSLLAPAVAVAVLVAVARGATQRIEWRPLLASAYAAALAWAFSLAAVDGTRGLTDPITRTEEYLRDVAGIGSDLDGFLAGFVSNASQHAVATRQHPPGPVVFLWGLHRLGLDQPLLLGALITALGCLTVPLVLVAVRSLCGEEAARRLAPALVLAPYALWVAVSLDAVTAALSAAMVTAGVLASEAGRRGLPAVLWALACGALLGVAALFSYAAPWLALSVICVYFVRRRPLLNVVTGTAALVPLALAQGAGFVWTDGLTAAQADFSIRVEPHRSAVTWGVVSLVVLVLACGPTLVASARKVRRTPGWPFLVGAVVAVAFAVTAGLARGEMEHAWLPYFPWLLVAAVAPEKRGGAPPPTPVILVAVGAGAAVLLAAVLQTTA